MLKISGLKLPVKSNVNDVIEQAAEKLNINKDKIRSFRILKRSIDARKTVQYVYNVAFETDNEQIFIKSKKAEPYTANTYEYPVCLKKSKKRVCVVGFGPAGMFAALTLAKSGVDVTVIERGSCVEQRKKDIELFKITGKLNTQSNVQFGEGGAGTFSDGKLYTGITDKRITAVLNTFVENSAPEDILYDSAPHVGTDLLCNVVKNIRNQILSLGAEIIFGAQMVGFIAENNKITSVEYIKDKEKKHIECSAVVLAIGHSSRDTVEMLLNKGVCIAPKPFAVGLRIEHPAKMINQSRYHEYAQFLPTADYKLVSHKGKRGVYSFCMCPGGEVIAAASEENGVCVNGMSYHARNSVNSNTALLVGVSSVDFKTDDVLAGMYFQRELEQRAFEMGGGDYKAPVQLLGDFIKGQNTFTLGEVEPSYKPGYSFARLDTLFNAEITESFKTAFGDFENKIKGYSRSDAVLTGVEARSSSPVRLLRNEQLESVNLEGLYPCGEGAGYAGGITSAAVDGIKCAEKIIEKINADV